MVDEIDEVGVLEFGEEVNLYGICGFLGCAGEVDFEGVELLMVTGEVDVGLSSVSEFEVDLVVVCELLRLEVCFWLHVLDYKRILSIDQF